MDCPACGQRTRVLESRRAEDGAAIRRRRQCPSCGHRFTSFERAEPEPLFVLKRNGERKPFDREKLRVSLTRAAHKRPVGAAEIDSLVARIVADVRAGGGEVEAARIGELCLDGLRHLDAGAYLQFAGVDLADPEAIRAEVEKLSAGTSSNDGKNAANRGRASRQFRPARVGSSVVPPGNEREERN